ncbi:MAG: hypothetical protein Q7J68_02185 [Thermoplasmata archaeon]|nr:hypothetical protein [Thermoplasmata archaeon]
MHKYQNCEPSEYILKTLFPSDIIRAPCGNPFLITDSFNLQKRSGYNLIQVYQPGEALIDRLDDIQLKQVLEHWNGFLVPPPSYSLLAVPESSIEELKFPICGIMKWVADQDEPVKIETIVEKLLGSLYSSFSKRGIAQLRGNVENIIYDLRKGPLSEYMDYNPKGKTVKINLDTSSAPRKKAFSDKLNTWLNIVPIERYLEEEDTEEDT